MKAYGANKATEFSRKQISVIYMKAKTGELKVEKWVIGEFYDLAEYYGYDDNNAVASMESKILNILNAVFAGEMDKAQELIDQYTADGFQSMSTKAQKKANRTLVA